MYILIYVYFSQKKLILIMVPFAQIKGSSCPGCFVCNQKRWFPKLKFRNRKIPQTLVNHTSLKSLKYALIEDVISSNL